jgi:predicted TIM-barrel fold metal-dependent hydrolase
LITRLRMMWKLGDGFRLELNGNMKRKIGYENARKLLKL